jgi:two-component system chemotaxis response regulator CheB
MADAPVVPPPFDVVAVAASAGGLEALGTLLAALPPDFPAAVVVVQHVDPKHRSLLAEILARRTALGVKQAADGDRLRPGWVFIATPRQPPHWSTPTARFP